MSDVAKRLRDQCAYYGHAQPTDAHKAANELDALRAENERIKAAAWKYGKHLTACRRQTDPLSWCDCGWVEIREKLAPTP